MKHLCPLLCGLLLLPVGAGSSEPAGPIIDMHLHALWWQPEMVEPLTGLRAPATEEELRRATIAALERYNVVKAIASGPHVGEYRAAAPDRIIAGLAVGSVLSAALPTDAAALRREIAGNGYGAIAEFAPQYDGVAPNDPRLEPSYAVAEELGLPLGIHVGLGPPGAAYAGFPRYRMALGNPLLLEDVLVRHPKLRLYVMHAGWPMIDQMLGLLYAHPQVYVDIAVINWVLPRAEFHAYLRRLVDAGFGRRIMFGSDQMMWPEALGRAIEAVESAAFLSAEQKRDVFYNNAARFLGLPDRAMTVAAPEGAPR
ncbi:MAG: amidohydrolase [Gammaproteobacteria bacterium]|nr:amidohydrolase [Gammaproteobacteria bacterium]